MRGCDDQSAVADLITSCTVDLDFTGINTLNLAVELLELSVTEEYDGANTIANALRDLDDGAMGYGCSLTVTT